MIDIRKLPVFQHRDLIIDALSRNRVVVVESPTGSGKTTLLPKILHDSGFAENGMIGVTQPRRIAALSVSRFIARMYGTEIPGLVGYKMRFVDQTTPETKIVIMTDGILLQELKSDPMLSSYSVVMVDEAHERSLNIDFILGLLKDILKKREDLKALISSATINTEVFSEYFGECPIVSIDAKMFPVTIVYDPPENLHDFDSTLDKIGSIITKIQRSGERGDVLIFLSGEGQIKECISALEALNRKKKLELLPLYARLSQEEQERVFQDFPGMRKVIVATNIAETSVTIDGVVHVIDPGYAKLHYYNTRNFTSSLVEVPISKASCSQRRGRAGRTAPGVCYRLYMEEDFEKRPLFTMEEIYRHDLSEVVLRMAELGVKEFERFDFISNPGYENIQGAVEVLELLEAVDENRELTSIGRMMVKFPLVPRLSRIIVASIMEYPEVLQEVLIAAAFLNDQAPFLLPHGLEIEARKAHHSFRHRLGDFVSYLRIYRAYLETDDREAFCGRYYLDFKGMEEIRNVASQFGEICSGMGIPLTGGGELGSYLCAISKGLIQYVCRRAEGASYKSLTAHGIKIHPGSVMYRERPDYIVAGEIVKTSQMYARSVSPLTPDQLRMISSEIYSAFVKRGIREKKRVRERDYTNFVKIGSEKFEIQIGAKKKKLVLLPVEKVERVLAEADIEKLHHLRNLKGKLLLGEFELLSGMGVKRILEIAPRLIGSLGIVETWPRGARFEYQKDAAGIVRNIQSLLLPCRKTPASKKLGFLTLLTDGEGKYWYSCFRDYLHALEESVSSLEQLSDEDMSILDREQEDLINETYRRLLELLER